MACASSSEGGRRVRRSVENFVELRENGWLVIGEAGHSLTKPFRTREQAEHFADLITGRALVAVPVLMLDGLPTIKAIPLFGVGSREDWVADRKPQHQSATGKRELAGRSVHVNAG